MNPIIEKYFDTIEARLIDSPAITSYNELVEDAMNVPNILSVIEKVEENLK